MWPRIRLVCVMMIAVAAAALGVSGPTPPGPPRTPSPDGSHEPAMRPLPHRLIYPAHGQVDEALAQVLPVVRMRGIRLEDAIDQLRERTGVNLFVDWNQLRSGETPPQELSINIDVRGVSLADALTLVLRSAGDLSGAGDWIEWGIEGGVVVLTNRDRVVRPIRVYDVRDIIDADVGRRVALDGPPATVPAENERRAKVAREEVVKQLEALLMAAVAPDSWIGLHADSPLNEFGGRLVIVQTWENHRRLEALLDSLRPEQLHSSPTTRAATTAAGADPVAPESRP
jgi:hypothetical protein